MSSSSKRYHSIRLATQRLRGLSPGARAEELEQLGSEDPELAREVEQWLAAAEEKGHPGRALEAIRDWLFDSEETKEGSVSGPVELEGFRILSELGAGGMGVVYEAEQLNPQRTVAIKFLSQGVSDPGMIRRFRREGAALARLQHPGIAQVIEIGSYEVGGVERPYIVMEKIDGVTLLKHADQAKLDRRARLELVARIAGAIQHAHDRGVIHRDLKPDNILVDERGSPRILDFGIARILDEASGLSVATAQGEIVGSLTHMAPEQVLGDPAKIGVPADVYALGTIAFQLLTGRLPRELAGLSLPEVIRRIGENDSLRPRSVDRSLSGDLDHILSKALETEPKRRYASAVAFGADLGRYLADEPVIARPASRVYRCRKFVRRNRALVGVMGAILIGFFASTYFGWTAQQRERDAEEARSNLERSLYLAQMRLAGRTDAGPQRLREMLEPWESPRPGRADLRGWEWYYLDHLTRSELAFTVPTISKPIGHPAHGRLMNVDGDLFDLATKEFQRGVGGRSAGVDWSEDGTQAWRVLGETELEVHDLERGLVARLTPGFPVGHAIASPDSRRVAVCSRSSDLAVYSLETGKLLWFLERGAIFNSGWASPFVFSPNGRLLLAFTSSFSDLSERRQPVVFDAQNGAVMYCPEWPEMAKTGVDFAWSPDGSKFALLLNGVRLEVHDLDRQRLHFAAETGTENGGLAWAFDSKRIALSGSTTGVWDVELGIELHRGLLGSVSIAWGRHGNHLVCFGGSGGAWDLSQEHAWQGGGSSFVGTWDPLSYVSASHNGRFFVSTHQNQISIWRDGDPLPIGRGRHRGKLPLLSKTGRYLSFMRKEFLYVVERATGNEVLRFAPLRSPPIVTWSPIRETEFLLHDACELSLHDIFLGIRSTATLPAQLDSRIGGWVQDCTLKAWAGGDYFLPLGSEGGAQVGRVGRDGAVLAKSETMSLSALALSPDGRSLAVAGLEGRVALLAADTLEVQKRLHVSAARVTCLAWHPSGSRLAVGNADGEVSLCDPRTLETLLVLEGGAHRMSEVWNESGSALTGMNKLGRLFRWSASQSFNERKSKGEAR